MATEKQIIANRRNAELSCGPRTDVGKKVSRMNALRHGLTGQIEVTTPEEKEAKDKFCGEIESSLAPEGGLERQIAHSIANGYRTRLWKTELAALADQAGLQITVCHFPPGS